MDRGLSTAGGSRRGDGGDNGSGGLAVDTDTVEIPICGEVAPNPPKLNPIPGAPTFKCPIPPTSPPDDPPTPTPPPTPFFEGEEEHWGVRGQNIFEVEAMFEKVDVDI